MKIARFIVFFCGLIPLCLLSSCEKTEYFKSESGVDKDLQGKWTLLPIPKTSPVEEWTFHEGKIYFTKQDITTGTFNAVDTGSYSVHTSLSKVEINIKDVEFFIEYNGTWEVVLLDGKILVIAIKHSGILERDFEKK